MNTIQVNLKDSIAYVTLNRGRSNAINAELCAELMDMITNIGQEEQTAGLVLTGKEGFFSAGLDLIELYEYNESQIRSFWYDFLALVSGLVGFRKPFVSAINGHAPAGGCVMALCSDYRVMTEGNFIIGLNEIPVGLIVPGSISALYSFWLGQAKASRFLLEGRLLQPSEARDAGLIDELVAPASLLPAAERQIKKYTQFNRSTWQQSKANIRHELLAKVNADPSETVEALLRQWWSPYTRSVIHTIIQNLTRKSSPVS